MDSLWVLILLLVALSTIVTVRIFLNGAQEEADVAGFEAAGPAETPAGVSPAAAPRTRAATRSRAASAAAAADTAAGAAPATAPAAATTPPARARRRAASRSAASTPSPPAVWPGGDCPSCGSPTIPSAKFCGECGHRLVP